MDEIKEEIEFRTVDEFGNEIHLHKKFSEDGLENGINIYSLYEEFINFLKASGFGEETINMVQLVKK